VEQIAAQPDTHERLTNIGTEAFFAGPDAFRQVLAEYRANFEAVIRQLGIRAE
jgi:tripartite-type tricarboxylate transporter receptor subunit TctC